MCRECIDETERGHGGVDGDLGVDPNNDDASDNALLLIEHLDEESFFPI